MKILDRYMLQKFLLPFVYCFLGFIAIWFIFDLSDNLPDFLQGFSQGTFTLAQLGDYYKSQIPQIVVLCLPIGELLALLYALTAMSRSNEIISMLGAGLSVNRILVPLMAAGLALVGVTAYFNYSSAPHAEMIKKQMLREIKRGHRIQSGLVAHLYRNREDNRTWFIHKVYVDKQRLSDIQIVQQDPQGFIVRQWYAGMADFNPATSVWTLTKTKYVEETPDGTITKSELKDKILITGWRETPWRIASSVMNPEWLSVPELQSYLQFNHDFPEARLAPYRTQYQYRWALPWTCLIVVFLAAPMGIVYSRRGILGGVATAIALFFSLMMVSYLFIALGKGYRISSINAAWTPQAFFFGIGLVLLFLRSTNREMPKFKLPWIS